MASRKFSPDILTDFAAVKLTDLENVEGFKLTSLTLAVLQNLRATVASEKLRLEFNPNNPGDFIQQEAYKRGQLDLLTYIIDEAIEANKIVNVPSQETPQ